MSKNKKNPEVKEYLLYFLKVFLNWLIEILSFIFVILKPWNIIGLTITIFSIFYSQQQTGNNKLIFDIISAIFASITSGIITFYIIEYLQKSTLIKKSVGAIRNLQLIKFKITNVSERIKVLTGDQNKRDFQEIDNLVQNIHKDILNSISDWSDINPASEEITDYYELVSQKQKKIDLLENEKKELEKRQGEAVRIKSSEITKLSEDITKKEEEIEKLKKNLNDYTFSNIQASGSLASGLNAGSVGFSNYNAGVKCRNCGNFYQPYVWNDHGLCQNCQQPQY